MFFAPHQKGEIAGFAVTGCTLAPGLELKGIKGPWIKLFWIEKIAHRAGRLWRTARFQSGGDIGIKWTCSARQRGFRATRRSAKKIFVCRLVSYLLNCCRGSWVSMSNMCLLMRESQSVKSTQRLEEARRNFGALLNVTNTEIEKGLRLHVTP